MNPVDLDNDRAQISALFSGGMVTEWKRRAYDDAEIRRVIDALQRIPVDASNRLAQKIAVSGFAPIPFIDDAEPEIEQSCANCMYYELHSRYCNLPELKLGVDAQWSCILWRV